MTQHNLDLETNRVVVSGKVQGVGYRFSAVRQAHELGVTGWVRNQHDGTVEAVTGYARPDRSDAVLDALWPAGRPCRERRCRASVRRKPSLRQFPATLNLAFRHTPKGGQKALSHQQGLGITIKRRRTRKNSRVVVCLYP